MKMEDKCMDLVFRNPVRREIAWKVSVQSDMNDIFVIDESYRSVIYIIHAYNFLGNRICKTSRIHSDII